MVYVASLSQPKFAGVLMVVDCCLKREKGELVIADADVTVSVLLGGWKYREERDWGVKGLHKDPWRYGMMAKF